MARMSRKLARTLSERFLPVVSDRAAAEAARDEARATLPALRDDLLRFGTMTERARVARFLTEIAEWSLLLEQVDEALDALEEARALLAVDERHAPIRLLEGRLAWAWLLQGEAARARALLTEILADSDRSVWAWRDTHALYLAAACVQLDDRAAAREALAIASALYAQEPKRDSSLVEAALARLA